MLMSKDDRVFRGFRLRVDTRRKLAELTERYKGEAPPFVKISQRAVIEILISYAARSNLELSELLGVLEEK